MSTKYKIENKLLVCFKMVGTVLELRDMDVEADTRKLDDLTLNQNAKQKELVYSMYCFL
jgi:hypothetical protein